MAGSFVVVVGIALLVLPGPGVLTIAAGLSLLRTEFEYARRYLQWCKRRTGRVGKYFAHSVPTRD